MTRTAISPRLAIRIFFSTSANVGGVDPNNGIPEDPLSGKGQSNPDNDHIESTAWADVVWPSGWSVNFVDETGSTNTDLLAAVERGEVGDRVVLAAGHQTAGRGRLDRRWDAPPGANLLTSIAFTTEPDPSFPFMAMVSLAAIDAIEHLAGASFEQRLGLKWPNDLLLDGRKLAGVLAQRGSATGATIVGIGVNVSWAPDDKGCVWRDLEVRTTPVAMLLAMLAALDEMMSRIDSRAHVASRYRQRLLTLGQIIRIELPGDRSVNGTAIDVDDDGRLLIDVDGTVETFDVGDVVHARPA